MECGQRKKLDMDCGGHFSLCARMDAERIDLIRRLCTHAGAIMEDASARALLMADLSDDGIRGTVSVLLVATERIKALVDAAAALTL